MAASTSYIKVGVEYREALHGLNRIARDQMPFAYARALTEVAKVAQLAVRIRMKEEFKLHGEYLPRGILIVPAKKSELISSGYTQSEVFTGDKVTPYLAIHEKGGQKQPVHGRKVISIPAKDFPKNGLIRTGAVKNSIKPKQLLQRKKTFVIRERGSKPAMIVQRVGRKKSETLRVIYRFATKAKIKPRFNMEHTVKTVVDKTFPRILEQSLAAAMADTRVSI